MAKRIRDVFMLTPYGTILLRLKVVETTVWTVSCKAPGRVVLLAIPYTFGLLMQ